MVALEGGIIQCSLSSWERARVRGFRQFAFTSILSRRERKVVRPAWGRRWVSPYPRLIATRTLSRHEEEVRSVRAGSFPMTCERPGSPPWRLVIILGYALVVVTLVLI